VRDDVDELVPPVLGVRLQLLGDVDRLVAVTHPVLPNVRPHRQEVDDAAEVVLAPDRQLR
jgi:hypothetical protein